MLTLNYTPPSDRFIILASGPSLRWDDIERVRVAHESGKFTVIAINRQCESAPWADILFATDSSWWAYFNPPDFKGKKYSIMPSAAKCGAEVLPFEYLPGLGKEKIRTHTKNSGGHSINLAYLLGAKEIILLGFDMKRGPNREMHNHEDYPKHMSNAAGLDSWAPLFTPLARDLEAEGVRVVNCSRDTALTCFERLPLESVL